jgi:hypothetical protein
VEIIGCEYFSCEASDDVILNSAFRAINTWPSPYDYNDEAENKNTSIMKLRLFDQNLEVVKEIW